MRMAMVLIVAALVGCAEEDETATSVQDLWVPPNVEPYLWSHNGNVVPMCWDEWLDIRSGATVPIDAPEIEALKTFITDTIEEGWIRPTLLKVTWEQCPVSGASKHVRVKIVLENRGPNGDTGNFGMLTLSTAADRGPGKDAAGLRVGLPSTWSSDSNSAAILLHEFGHILGFGHDFNTPGNRSDSCYRDNEVYGGISIGGIDPRSIMNFSYCSAADAGVMSTTDIYAAASIYGAAVTHLAPTSVWSNAFCAAGQECHLGDIDGDGREDLVAFAHAGASNSYVWVGHSTGGVFEAAVRKSLGFCARDQTCDVGDVNGDHRADLVAYARGGSAPIWVSYSQADGSFSTPTIRGYGCRPGEICKLADVNRDGRKDLVVFSHGVGGSNAVRVLRSTDTGFLAPEQWQGSFCLASETCDVGDVDGDNQADLVAFSRGGTPNVWVALSHNWYFGGPQIATTYFCPSATELCSVADIDADGRADLVSFTHDAYHQVWVSRAMRDRVAFTTPSLWSTSFCTSNQKCLVGNFNGNFAGDMLAFDNGYPTNRVWGQSGDYGPIP